MLPIEQSALYRALHSVDVDDELSREAAEESLDRRKIPDDVTESALYRAFCSKGAPPELACQAVEEARYWIGRR